MSTSILYGDENSWYVCDFETSTHNTDYFDETNDAIVILANSTNYKTQEHHTFTNINDWFNFHLNLGISQTLFFHNLSFDGMFILNYLETQNIKPFNPSINRNNYYELFNQGNKIYYIRVRIKKRINGEIKKFNLMIRCSLRLLNSSIGSLGKSLGLDKHHEDDFKTFKDENGRIRNFYDKEPLDSIEQWEINNSNKRFLEYCRNDCLIANLSLKEFSNAVNSISFVKEHNKRIQKRNDKRNRHEKYFNPLNYLTTASLTSRLMELSIINYIKKNKLKNFYPLQLNRNDYLVIEKWFAGGFTQFNEKFSGNAQKCGLSLMVDVSSAYPYQMTFSLPYGEILSQEPEGVNMRDYYTFYEIDVKSAKIKPEYYDCPVLKKWSNDETLKDIRYPREQYNFKCFYTDFEWEMITKFYDVKIKKISVCWMKAAPYLKEYANELYNLKNHYAETKQDGLKQATKILINAGYGCTAKRLKYDTSLIYHSNDLMNEFFNMERDTIFNFGKYEYKFHFLKDFNFDGSIKRVVCETTKDKNIGTNKAAAVVITSRERVYLWKLIDYIGAEHFGYSDTDSILFVNLTPEKYNYIKEMTKHRIVKLGDWELELANKNITYFGTYGAKKYQMLDENKELIKFRFAGISDSMIKPKELLDEIDFNDESITIQNAILKKCLVKSGIILIPQDKIMKKGKN